jgi:hypothetical protein
MVRSTQEHHDPRLPRNAYEARYGRTITREESWAMLDGWCREFLGIGVEEFARRYHAGEYGDVDHDGDISMLAFRLEALERNPPVKQLRR